MKRKWLILGIVVLGVLALLIPLSFGGLSGIPHRSAPSATVIFGGDMLFDRYIRKVGETVGWDYPFSCIDRTLQEADIVIANLEGPVTDNESVAVMNEEAGDQGFIFTFPLSIAPYLSRHNIRVINLGNNHIFNFGYDGIRQTMDALSRANLLYMGPPRFPEGLYDLDEKDYTMATTTVAGVPLAFISYNEFDPEGGAASAARAISAIKDARAASSTPVIFAHWGDEYAPAAPRVKKLARQFVDAGAALVVGSHPHVVEERETYKDALIYYSLGNFIFDQYWSDDVRNGLLLKVIFSGGKAVSVTEIPIVLQKDGRTCLSTLPSGAAEKP